MHMFADCQCLWTKTSGGIKATLVLRNMVLNENNGGEQRNSSFLELFSLFHAQTTVHVSFMTKKHACVNFFHAVSYHVSLLRRSGIDLLQFKCMLLICFLHRGPTKSQP